MTRDNPRYSFFADAEITLNDGTSIRGQVSELSAGGCSIDMLESVPIGTELHLLISDGISSCELPGKVIYANNGGGFGVFGIGVVFGERAVDQYCVIDRWLREVAERRRPRPQTGSTFS